MLAVETTTDQAAWLPPGLVDVLTLRTSALVAYLLGLISLTGVWKAAKTLRSTLTARRAAG